MLHRGSKNDETIYLDPLYYKIWNQFNERKKKYSTNMVFLNETQFLKKVNKWVPASHHCWVSCSSAQKLDTASSKWRRQGLCGSSVYNASILFWCSRRASTKLEQRRKTSMWIQRTSRMKVKGAVREGTDYCAQHTMSTPQATSTRHLHIFLA